MSRKKKNSNAAVPVHSGPRRVNISVEEAENGAVVHTSGEGRNGEYISKKHVAPDGHTAIRIATAHLSSMFHKGRSKKTKRKSSPSKIAFSK